MALTAAQITELENNNPTFKGLVARFGPPKSVASCDAAGAKPGDICLEEACVGGQMKVKFCDASGNCTGSGTVMC